MKLFNLDSVHPSWRSCLNRALKTLDLHYLQKLYNSNTWLPGHNNLFNSFSLPMDQTQYVLLGESPYPRAQSANGYAFWDAAVQELWSHTGLSKTVNRATSLRNMIKMLLVAEKKLDPFDTSQSAIANMDKTGLVTTNADLFNNLLNQGFLLLNATPVLQIKTKRQDAMAWRPFMHYVLNDLLRFYPKTQLILFGKLAQIITQLIDTTDVQIIQSEHPYNLSFIHNKQILALFQPMHLLRNTK